MNEIIQLFSLSLEKVWVTFSHNWPFLLASILISVALRLYLKPDSATAFLTRYRRVGVVGATAVAVATPFCSCGTTAVILGMIASTIPWAPIVAFMVASPLTSPEELIYSAGLFGWPFAMAFFVSSILLGLLGGLAAEFCESRGWLAGQARFQPRQAASRRDIRARRPVLVGAPALAFETASAVALPLTATDCGCSAPAPAAPESSCGCDATAPAAPAPTCGCGESPQPAGEKQAVSGPKVTPRRWLEEIYQTGKQLLVMFFGFALIGYFLNGLIPASWIAAVFGSGHVYSVPLAATLGLPLYVNTEGSLPLVRALIDGGMSQGAALAFLITGAGTSFGAVAGALTIARWRVIALVVGTLWVGAVALGFAYDFLLAAHLL